MMTRKKEKEEIGSSARSERFIARLQRREHTSIEDPPPVAATRTSRSTSVSSRRHRRSSSSTSVNSRESGKRNKSRSEEEKFVETKDPEEPLQEDNAETSPSASVSVPTRRSRRGTSTADNSPESIKRNKPRSEEEEVAEAQGPEELPREESSAKASRSSSVSVSARRERRSSASASNDSPESVQKNEPRSEEEEVVETKEPEEPARDDKADVDGEQRAALLQSEAEAPLQTVQERDSSTIVDSSKDASKKDATTKTQGRQTRSSRSSSNINDMAAGTASVAPIFDNNDQLDEPTLDDIFRYLSTPSIREDVLDEEDVLVLMHRTTKTAMQQTRNYRSLGNYHHSEETDTDSIFEECLAQAEDQALADDFFQDMVQYLEEDESVSARSRKNRNRATAAYATLNEPKKSLDRRTVSWVKRSMGAGLRKRSVPSRFNQHLLAPRGHHHRRYTRGMAKSSKKKKEKGLDVLHRAVAELEKERGEPFRLPPPPSRRRSLSPVYQADDEDNAGSGRSKRKAKESGEVVSKKQKTDKISKIKRKQESNDKRDGKKPRRAGPGICLVSLDSQRRELLENNEQEVVDRTYETRSKVELPQEYSKLGIIHRLPTWDDISLKISAPPLVTPTPTSEEDRADQYSKIAKKLGQKLPLPAMCQQFYSDLDRAWYEKAWNECGTNGTKIDETDSKVFVAQPGWKKLRRGRFSSKPRRLFSENFIRSELQERNDYRQAVRLLQQRPELADRLGFPYKIPSPLKTETSVLAFHPQQRTVKKGTVKSYEPKDATYLIQFDSADPKLCVCPDSEVASLSKPTFLTTGEKAEAEKSKMLLETKTQKSVQALDKVTELAQFEPLRYRGKQAQSTNTDTTADKRKIEGSELIELVAEREALITLMLSINKALFRKESLLNAFEKLDEIVASKISPEVLTQTTVSAHVKCHRLWLEHSIRQTDALLDKLLGYLNVFYGRAYLPQKNPVHTNTKLSREHIQDLLNDLPNASISLAIGECCKSLLDDAKEFGEKLTANALYAARVKQADALAKSRLVSVAQMLLASSFASSLASPELGMAMSEELKQAIVPYKDCSPVEDAFLTQVKMEREDAIKDLQDAMHMLHTELSLSSLSTISAPSG